MSAGMPRRPRQRLLRCRFAKASYTAATMASSASTVSACGIHSSRRSLTSSAINPSPKLRCARRISIMPSPRAPSMRLWPQQLMIELADVLDRLLQLLIIVEPATNLGHPLASHAELLRAPASIGHRQHEDLVPLTTGAFRAASGMSDSALQQRPAQQLAGDRQLADKLVARLKGPIANHLLE